jgi:hypothetical protein
MGENSSQPRWERLKALYRSAINKLHSGLACRKVQLRSVAKEEGNED